MHHDAFLARAVQAVASVDPSLIARAWLHSIETRDHGLRSAWGSLVLLQHLHEHSFEPSTVFHESACAVCGLGIEVEAVSEQRLAENGYRYLVATVDWAVADIEGAERRVHAASLPRESERGILQEVLDAISDLPDDAQLTQLNSALVGRFASNRYERMRVLEQLGCAGILPVRGHPSYASQWVRWEDANSRQPPERGKREWTYPIRFWSGVDGVDRQAAADSFGR